MTLVFDTSILIEIERKNPVVISSLKNLAQDYSDVPAITFATFSEFYYGFLRKFKKKRQRSLEELDKYRLLNSSGSFSKRFSQLKFELEQKGVSISLFNIMVAALVLENGMTLVTCDNAFKKVPNLDVIIL